ncbi:unnamed protein product [Auanema sp. JU1783]|nr:unnamed protein product [Auanema sp. JU1783]
MGPPPAPPPPPILKPTTTLSLGRRPTENASRRNNNPVPAASQPSRPRVDSQALQHAAARLRKTGYNQQIRGDFSDLSNGRVDRSSEQLPGQHWQNSEKQPELDSNQARESVLTPPSSSNQSSSYHHVHRNTNSVNTGSTNQPHNTYRYSNNISPYQTSNPNDNQYSIYSKNFNASKNISEPFSKNYSSSRTVSYSSIPVPASTFSIQSSQDNFPTSTYEPSATQNRDNSRTSADTHQPQGVPPQPSTTIKNKPTHPNSFAIELRDKGLTSSQREANQFKHSQRQCESDLPFDVTTLLQNSFRGDEVDQLVMQMANQLRSNESPNRLHETSTSSCSNAYRTNTMQRSNICVSCSNPITFEKPGCVALDQVFHVSCFNCKKCGRILAGSSFYNIDNNPTCESCYTESLDKCTKCGQPITDKLLRACGGTFHVECFICTVCATALDGVPFTIDSDNNVHCVPCFHEKFAPRCAVCQRGIIPIEGEKESVRVVAMDKSFHVECYRCEDCGLQLSSKIEGQGCYPLDSHLYCKTCNSNRLRVLANV